MIQPYETIKLDFGDRGYDIVIGPNLLEQAGTYIFPVMRSKKYVIITDENVAGLYLEKLQTALSRIDLVCKGEVILSAGEQAKSFSNFHRTADQILSFGIDRSTTIIALGGGVVGDLAGFLAATLLRGIDFIQIPTTLLAQVDSSVGGKTGINSAHGKNLVGAFHQPNLVLIDTNVLDTLPNREFLAGYAEVVKYGLINDPEFFEWLEMNVDSLVVGDVQARQYAIAHSCKAKAHVVAQDEKEAGMRALLNLGHTFGHAIEAEAGYDGTVLHGEAVAVGMVQAFDLSVIMGLCPPDDAVRVRKHLERAGLKTRVSDFIDVAPEKLIAHMAKDKKVQDGKMTFILAEGIGKSFVTSDVSKDDVLSVLELDT